MIKLYLKQAWTLIKQNKLFTSIYVVGTGLSIALTMTMFIIFYVKFAPIYPEYNRDRMLTIKAMKCYPKTNKESWNCNGGLPVAVLSESLAKRIFASTDVVGKYFTFNGKEFRVCGVVQDVSNATPDTAGDLWIPLFLHSWVSRTSEGEKLIGNVQIYMLAPTPADKEALRAEVQDVFRKYNLQTSEYENDLMQQPDDFWKSTFRKNSCEAPDWGELLKGLIYILLALLFIPAMNLSGMISSRMDHRLCELGVRRAYGATNKILLGQVLWENLLLTCLGGLIGILLSYLIVLTASDWILNLFDDWVNDPDKTPFLSFEMLFNPWIFSFAFVLCVLLNLISAFVPALWSLRHTIIQSLNTKR